LIINTTEQTMTEAIRERPFWENSETTGAHNPVSGGAVNPWPDSRPQQDTPVQTINGWLSLGSDIAGSDFDRDAFGLFGDAAGVWNSLVGIAGSRPYQGHGEMDALEHVTDFFGHLGGAISGLNALTSYAPAPWLGPAFTIGARTIETGVYAADGNTEQAILSGAELAVVGGFTMLGALAGRPGLGAAIGQQVHDGYVWGVNQTVNSDWFGRLAESYESDRANDPRGYREGGLIDFTGYVAGRAIDALAGRAESGVAWLEHEVRSLYLGDGQ
jgi:hypothetical protein